MLLLVLLLAGCSFNLTEQHFFHPGPAEKQDDASQWQLPNGAAARDITLTMADGTALHAVRVTRPDATAEVLYFGGDVFRTENFGAFVAREIAETGAVNVLMIDYRGYGRSAGTPTLPSLKSDAIEVYDWLRAQSQLPAIVHGFSLGSFVAAHLAAERQPAGLVLESTATNVREWAALQTPMFVSVKVADALAAEDNVARLKRYNGALLILAGTADKVTPVSMSRKLIDASPSPFKKLVVVEGGGHGNVFQATAATDGYRQLLAVVTPG